LLWKERRQWREIHIDIHVHESVATVGFWPREVGVCFLVDVGEE